MHKAAKGIEMQHGSCIADPIGVFNFMAGVEHQRASAGRLVQKKLIRGIVKAAEKM